MCQIWYPQLAPVSRYWAKLILGYFRFLDSWSILYKKNCHNSRTNDNIEMKLGPVTKPDKKNKITLKKIEDNVISRSCDVVVIFPVFGQCGAIRKPDSGCTVCKTYIFINSNLLSYKNWKQSCKVSNTALTLFLWVKLIFMPKKYFFLQKILTSAKLRGSWYQKVYFTLPLSTSKQTPRKLTHIRVKARDYLSNSLTANKFTTFIGVKFTFSGISSSL